MTNVTVVANGTVITNVTVIAIGTVVAVVLIVTVTGAKLESLFIGTPLFLNVLKIGLISNAFFWLASKSL